MICRLDIPHHKEPVSLVFRLWQHACLQKENNMLKTDRSVLLLVDLCDQQLQLLSFRSFPPHRLVEFDCLGFGFSTFDSSIAQGIQSEVSLHFVCGHGQHRFCSRVDGVGFLQFGHTPQRMQEGTNKPQRLFYPMYPTQLLPHTHLNIRCLWVD